MSLVLTEILKPLSAYYSDSTVIELQMNRPKRVVLERRDSGKISFKDDNLSLHAIKTICKALANNQKIIFDEVAHPRLSTVLPEGHRFECLVGGNSRHGLSLAIRVKHNFKPEWSYLTDDERIRPFLLDAVKADKNILVSGATNTGKTTLLNMLLEALPDDKRVVTVEDTFELDTTRFNYGVSLLCERENSANSGMLDYRQLYDHMMRITPDSVIFGEVSTSNAYAALSALNSGITGFMCSIHAETPYQAIHRKFKQNIDWSGESMLDVGGFVKETVDLVIQIRRDNKGKRFISDLYLPKEDKFQFVKEGQKL